MQAKSKIAYVLLCHEDPTVVARTAHALKYEQDRVFVHVDKKSDIRPFESALSRCENVVFADKRIETFWGGFNSIVATMETVRQALDYDSYDRVILLQGKDYPLLSPRRIHAFFDEHEGEEFCKARDITVSSDPRDYMKCCGYWYQDALPTLKTKVIRKLLSILNVRVGRKYRPGSFQDEEDDWHVYKGWAQFALTDDCARYVLAVYDNNSKFNDYMRHRFPPDKIYVHTILCGYLFHSLSLI